MHYNMRLHLLYIIDLTQSASPLLWPQASSSLSICPLGFVVRIMMQGIVSAGRGCVLNQTQQCPPSLGVVCASHWGFFSRVLNCFEAGIQMLLFYLALGRPTARNGEFLRDLGAAKVVEYGETSKDQRKYDFVVETVGGELVLRCWQPVKGNSFFFQ